MISILDVLSKHGVGDNLYMAKCFCLCFCYFCNVSW